MDYKGRMDAYAIDSYSNLPDEVVSTIRQRGENIIGIYEYYIYITLLYIFNYLALHASVILCTLSSSKSRNSFLFSNILIKSYLFTKCLCCHNYSIIRDFFTYFTYTLLLSL